MFKQILKRNKKIVTRLTILGLLFSAPLFLQAITIVKPVTSGLKLHVTFDQGYRTSTTFTDTSGQGTTATINGTIPTIGGKVSQAATFNGAEYIDIGGSVPPSLQFTNNMSIAFWINPSASQVANATIMGLPGGFHGYKIVQPNSNTNSYYFGWIDSTSQNCMSGSYFTLTPNTWQHVVITKNGTLATVYINGVQAGSCVGANTATISYCICALNIGRMPGSSDYFNGSLDDFRMYDRTLTAAEAKTLAIPSKVAAVSSPKVGNSSSPVAWWTFDGGDVSGTTVIDKSGNGNTGTTSGSPSNIVGKIGQAINLNGSQYVNFGNPSSLNFTGDMTASFWVKPASFPGSLTVLLNKHSSGSAGFALQEQSGDMIFAWGNGSYTCDSLPTNKVGTLTLGVWQHVTIVKSGSTVTGYINGIQSGSCTGAFSTISTNADSVLLGRWSSSNSRYFDGKFDDVRLYGRAVTRTEIQTLYKTGQNTASFGAVSLSNVPVSNGLVAYHSFDGKYMSGTTATDRAGTNTGTMTGGMSATSSARIGKVGQAVYFDGLDDRLDLGSATLADDSGFSLSFWAKNASSTSPYMTVRLKGTTTEFTFAVGHCSYTSLPTVFYFGFRGTGTSIRLDDSRYCIDTTVNKWNHYTVTYNGAGKTSASNWSLYVNGVPLSGFSTGANIGNFSNASELGSDGPNGGLPSNYALDDLRVYNRVITSKEVTTIYRSTK